MFCILAPAMFVFERCAPLATTLCIQPFIHSHALPHPTTWPFLGLTFAYSTATPSSETLMQNSWITRSHPAFVLSPALAAAVFRLLGVSGLVKAWAIFADSTLQNGHTRLDPPFSAAKGVRKKEGEVRKPARLRDNRGTWPKQWQIILDPLQTTETQGSSYALWLEVNAQLAATNMPDNSCTRRHGCGCANMARERCFPRVQEGARVAARVKTAGDGSNRNTIPRSLGLRCRGWNAMLKLADKHTLPALFLRWKRARRWSIVRRRQLFLIRLPYASIVRWLVVAHER